MIWTKIKPTTPGYYFYKDNITDHDVIPVDYLWDKEDLSYWNEFTHSWMLVKDAPDDVKWSDNPIDFPEQGK
jgi:hypothetical protein